VLVKRVHDPLRPSARLERGTEILNEERRRVVGRVEVALSSPRGESAPPITTASGRAALIASYDAARSASYAGAAASVPSALNCGSQYRLMFGSLPTMNRRTGGKPRATAAANCANCARRSGVFGVELEPTL
jgi:hypothetical protein